MPTETTTFGALTPGDRAYIFDRECVVVTAPEPAAGGRVRLTVSLPGGAPMGVSEYREHPVEVVA